MFKYFLKYSNVLFPLIAFVIYIPFIGSVPLFDWDEVNFAESAREMLVTGNYFKVTVNYEPFWEKPPLFFWMQALSMKLLGVNAFAARFPNVICGALTIFVILWFGRKYVSYRHALVWASLYLVSFTPHFYFRTGIIDPWFNLFIFLGVIQLFIASKNSVNKRRHFLFSGIFLGLAVLTKGPVALLIAGLCGLVFWISRKGKPFFNLLDLAVLAVPIVCIPFAWFGPETIKNGWWFIREFVIYQWELLKQPVASHGQPWFYHILVLFFGCFPAAPLLFTYKSKPFLKGDLDRWMWILFFVVLVLFSSVTTKIVHYSSLCYLPLTFLAARGILGLINQKKKLDSLQKTGILLSGLPLAVAIGIIPFILNNKSLLLGLDLDAFTRGVLSQDSSVSIIHLLWGLILLATIIMAITRPMKKQNVLILAIGLLFTWQGALAVVVKEVHRLVQQPFVSFYTDLQGKDVYIDAYKFKSYAPYYFGKVEPVDSSDQLFNVQQSFMEKYEIKGFQDMDREKKQYLESYQQNWFLEGQDLDKPVYFCARIERKQELEAFNLEFLYQKGGYIFYRRMPNSFTN